MARARPLNFVSSCTITASDPPTVARTSFRLIAGVASELLGTAAAGAGLHVHVHVHAHVRTASAAAIVAGAAVGTAAAEAPEAPATPVPRGGL
eukprot:scaffold31483_cov70-Phaeocystis_antarctica.AAC.6